MKPVASVPASMPQPSGKTGTSIVKTAPPKETARITVKPNLPVAAVRAPGNFPVAKAVAGAAPAVAVAAGAAVAARPVAKPVVAGGKPATTIVKTAGAPKVAAASIKPSVATAAPPVPAMPAQFQEEGSTMLTTVLAAVLALLTWGTATVLILSFNGVI